MSWYKGTFACGCVGEVSVGGSHKDREWRIDYGFRRDCPKCYNQKKQDAYKKANEEAIVKAEQQELPPLVGTEKQVAWANTLRIKLLENLSEIDEDVIDMYMGIELFETALNVFKQNETRASSFIDYRNYSTSYILDEIKKFYEKHIEKVKQEEQFKDHPEIILYPDEVKHEGIVIIKIVKKVLHRKILVIYEKNDLFIDLVKKLKYKWNEDEWELKFTERMVSMEDRAAELGCLLLQNGFTVSIEDEDARNKVIKKEFTESYTKWVTYDLNSYNKRVISIWWEEYSDSIYKKAKKLTNATWESGRILIDMEHYEEVVEFANELDFGISKGLINLIKGENK